MLTIDKPAFVVDKEVCRANIRRMAAKAASKGLRFRPHFKTHQSAEIGEWFREAGTTAITVSSLTMARYFAAAGWKDITVAFPVNILEIAEINRLAAALHLNLLVDNEISARFLADHLESPVGVWIETDTGHHRSGVDALKTRRMDLILDLLKKCSLIAFRGFLSHSGNAYAARSREEILTIHADAQMKMRSLKNHYLPEWPALEISMGDTPSCCVCDNWEGVDEIRPGNFVFFDLYQHHLGVCSEEEVAVRVFCPVVSRAIMRNEAVVFGGAVHFSKDFLVTGRGKKSFGALVTSDPETGKRSFSDDLYLAALSQEHGIIRGPFEKIRNLAIGDLVEIVPVHSCLTADLAGHYLATTGETIGKMNRSGL